MPAQKPHRSRQDYATSPAFLAAVERRFGRIRWDLAAHADNHVTREKRFGAFFGPGSIHSQDALSMPWAEHFSDRELLWLNPPFAHIRPWAEKCAAERAAGARIALLVPAGVGAAWYERHVAPHAYVFALRPRLSFDGVAPYPRDLILALYEPAGYRGFELWNWRPKAAPKVAEAEREETLGDADDPGDPREAKRTPAPAAPRDGTTSREPIAVLDAVGAQPGEERSASPAKLAPVWHRPLGRLTIIGPDGQRIETS
jgi:hypothetical protein